MEYNKEEIREKFKDLFEYSLDFIFVHDLKGNFLDANEIALTTLGFEREDLPNISFLNLIDEEQLKMAFELLKKVLKEGKQGTQAEYKLKTKDGNLIYVETYGIPLGKEGKRWMPENKIVRPIVPREGQHKTGYRQNSDGINHDDLQPGVRDDSPYV